MMHMLSGLVTRVFRNLTLFRKAENGEKILNNHYVIADGAYSLKSWLMTPFRDNVHLSPAQKRFSHLLGNAINVSMYM